jgi:hypothetical protein
MPTTTKMGIVYPSSTDLVKDGATAMGTISTTVDNKTGLVFISTATFTTAASVSFPANTFNANFDNYRIKINGTSTGDVGMSCRLRAAGTDNSSSNYKYSGLYMGASSGPTLQGSNGTTAFDFATCGDNGFAWTFDLEMPFATNYTTIFSTNQAMYGTDIGVRMHIGAMTVTTSYDSLTFYPASGTFSGTYSVFGYND